MTRLYPLSDCDLNEKEEKLRFYRFEVIIVANFTNDSPTPLEIANKL